MPNVKNALMLGISLLLIMNVVSLQASVDKSVMADINTAPLVFGVFPYLPPRELEKIFAPFAESMGGAIGKEMLFESTNSYQNFMERSDSQLYDIAFVQPFDYVRLADKFNYVPLATRGEKLASIIVVSENSPINSVQELRGKTIATPPSVAAVTRLADSFLRQHNIIPGIDVNISRQRSHASCLQQVLIRAADACISAAPPVRFMQRKMQVVFKTIARTREIPHTLFVANKRLSPQQRKIILNTIMSWVNTKSGKKMLRRGAMKSFIPIQDSDYDVVREIMK